MGNTNPEMDYTDIVHGITAENQIDFLNCAVSKKSKYYLRIFHEKFVNHLKRELGFDN